jgi:hypothetical protein
MCTSTSSRRPHDDAFHARHGGRYRTHVPKHSAGLRLTEIRARLLLALTKGQVA